MELTPAEREMAGQIGFDEATLLLVKERSGKDVERLIVLNDDDQFEPGNGISVAVANGHEAERLMKELSPAITPSGYEAFWSERRKLNGGKETDEVVVLKTDDPYAMVRLRRSDGGNYGITTEDIIDRLTAWRQMCDFTVVGASRDWVALVFSRLPERICWFAEEVYQFCPDTVDQGVGLSRKRDDPERFEAALRLCPQVRVPPPREDTAELLGMMSPEMASKFKICAL
jgi:Domain of unknown function (DUF4253)